MTVQCISVINLVTFIQEYNEDLEEEAAAGKWPDFPSELTSIICFLFSKDEADPQVACVAFIFSYWFIILHFL